MQPPAEDLLLVGHIVRPHGVRGELKVAPETDDPARLDGLQTLYLGRTARDADAYTVGRLRFQHTKRGPLALVCLDGIDTREAGEALVRLAVFVAEDALPPLDEGEAFVHDLVGLTVVTEDGAPVGTVRKVMPSPAHPIYVVECSEGEGEVLIPAVEPLVADVDLDARRLVIRPIEGLLE